MAGKVLIFTNNDSGFYDFRKEIIVELKKLGYEVYISTPDNGFIGKLQAVGATTIPTELDRRGMNPKRDIKLFNTYRNLLKNINPDIVFTYTIKPNVYGGVACSLAHVPYICNVTGLGSTLQISENDDIKAKIKQKLVIAMYKAGLRKADCVFFQNEYNLGMMKKFGCIGKKQHTRLLPGSGVNTEEHIVRTYPEVGKKVNLLSIGRIMDDKGSAELLEAAENLSISHPELLWNIVGDFEQESKEKYEPWVNRLETEGIVKFHGYRDDVDTFYEMCDALVHPSYHEGMSNVVLEAASSARPVLTSNIPGCREIYEDGTSGLGFEAKNTESIIDCVERFLSLGYEKRREMGLEARMYVEQHFDRKLVVSAYVDELNRIIKEAK